MATLKLTQDQLKLIAFELEEGQSEDGFTVVKKGEWTQDGKSQYKEVIFAYGNKYWRIWDSRSGSPFTDWYYEIREGDHDGIAYQVEAKQVTTTVWENV